jgi:hypothetical protein
MASSEDDGMKRSRALFIATLTVASLIAPGCGASMQRTALQELEGDGFTAITLQPVSDSRNTFTFEAERDDQPCRGEIILQQQMGQTIATVSSRCEPIERRATPPRRPETLNDE